MMYQNNYPATPNWNSPIQQNYPYQSQAQVPNFPQQMAQYGPSNMGYPQNNQNGNTFSQNTIRGRVISDISQITPNEVPMDGSVSLFPSQDYSCIYAKQWATDGTIKTMKYIPSIETQVVEKNQADPVDILRTDVMSRLDDIQGMISSLTQVAMNGTTKKTSNTRKEAE